MLLHVVVEAYISKPQFLQRRLFLIFHSIWCHLRSHTHGVTTTTRSRRDVMSEYVRARGLVFEIGTGSS